MLNCISVINVCKNEYDFEMEKGVSVDKMSFLVELLSAKHSN